MITFNNQSPRAFVAKYDGNENSSGFVIFALRGTDEAIDWANNSKLFAVNFPSGRNAVSFGEAHSVFMKFS